MPRTPDSLANPFSRELVLANIATDDTVEATRKVFFQSQIADFAAVETGSLSFFDVADYVPVFLEVGDLYNFSVESAIKPAIFLNDGEGYTYVTIDPDDIFGANPDDVTEDSIISFTPDFTGLHYVNIGPEDPSFFGVPSSYTLTITQDAFSDGINNLFPPVSTVQIGDDISHNFNEAQPIVAGQSITSVLNSGPDLENGSSGIEFWHDRDAFSITLIEGITYKIDMSAASFRPSFTLGFGSQTGGTSISQIATGISDTSSVRGETASLTFQSPTTLSYGITAITRNEGSGFNFSPTDIGGQYTISVQETTDLTNAYVRDGVYRFFNTDTGTHFYSSSIIERDSIIANLPNFNLEGPSFKQANTTNGPTASVFRFFNTETGTHFFTQSTIETEHITANLPSFNLEGEAYLGYTEEVAGSTPLYRFFNTDTGTHFYTAAEAEKDSIVANLPNFNFEGTAYWVDPVMG
jgi:hypothetical protein